MLFFVKQKTMFCKNKSHPRMLTFLCFLEKSRTFLYFCIVNPSLNERNTGTSTKSMFGYTLTCTLIVL